MLTRQADLYKRVVIWQPASRFVVDLGRKDFKRAATPNIGRGYFTAADGSDYPNTSDMIFELTVTDSFAISQLRHMKAIGCPVRVFAIGHNKGVVIGEETEFDLTPVRPGVGSLTGMNLRIRNSYFRSLYSDSINILRPYEFFGASIVGTGIANEYYVVTPFTIHAPFKWIISGAATPPTINDLGQLVITEGVVTLEFEFPLGGATVRLDNDPAATGLINTQLQPYDVAGATWPAAVPTATEYVLSDETWGIRIVMNGDGVTPMITGLPSFTVIRPAKYAGAVRTGTIPDSGCTPSATVPAWTVTAVPTGIIYTIAAEGKVFKAKRDGTDIVELATGLSSNVRQVAHYAGFAYFTDGPSVKKVSLSGGAVTTVFTHTSNVWGIAVDADYIFFSDNPNDKVWRIAHDGTGAFNILSADGPIGLDLSGPTLYIALFHGKAIQRIQTDGTGLTTVVDMNAVNRSPYDVKVHDGFNYLYLGGGSWIDSVAAGGTNRLQFLAQPIAVVQLAIPTDEMAIYFAGGGNMIQKVIITDYSGPSGTPVIGAVSTIVPLSSFPWGVAVF